MGDYAARDFHTSACVNAENRRERRKRERCNKGDPPLTEVERSLQEVVFENSIISRLMTSTESDPERNCAVFGKDLHYNAHSKLTLHVVAPIHR